MLHRLADMECPPPNQIHFKLLTEGLKKTCKKPVKQAEVMTHQTLKEIYHHVDFTSELEAVAWVAVLVGFTLILRVSNLGPEARHKFDPDRNFMRDDYMFMKNLPSLSIRWSKTIQHHNKVMWAPLVLHSILQSVPRDGLRKCAR